MNIRKYENVFITVNYNNYKITLDYVTRIESLDILIIVIDNNSELEDYNSLNNKLIDKDNVVLIRNEKNLGYFKGLNIGLEYLKNTQLKPKFVTIGNNDLIFENQYLEKLKHSKFNDDVLAIVPDVVTIEGIHQNPHVINRVSNIRKIFYDVYYTNYYLGSTMIKCYHLFKKERKKELYNEKINIYMGIGAIYILTDNFFNHFSFLDDKVFLWGEEALFGNQIKSVGGKITYDPNIKVQHLESLTTKKLSSKSKYEQSKLSYSTYKKYL